MNGRLYRSAALPAAAVVLTLAGGCMTGASLRRDVERSRIEAAKARAAGPAREGTGARIEGNLSLQDAVRLALAGNRSLQALAEERRVASGREFESYAAVLPHATAGASYTRLDAVTSFDVAGNQISMGFLDNYSSELTVMQPIFHGGASMSAVRTAGLLSLLADEQVRAATQGTIFQTGKAYFEAVLAAHLVRVHEDATSSAERHLQDVRRRKEQGTASAYDVLRVEVEVSSYRAEPIRQRNALSIAETALRQVMGVSQDSRFEPAEQLAFKPVAPVLEEAARLAQEKRPDLVMAEIGVRVQREAVTMARSRFWPQVDAFFNYSWANPDPHSMTSDEWGDAWTAGAKLTFSLFDGLGRYGKLAQENARMDQARTRLADAEEQAAADVHRAILTVRDTEELAKSQEKNLELSVEGLRLVEASYKEGVTTELQVLDARAALTRAQAMHYQALFAHTMARMGLQLAMGTLGPEAGSTRGDEGEAR